MEIKGVKCGWRYSYERDTTHVSNGGKSYIMIYLIARPYIKQILHHLMSICGCFDLVKFGSLLTGKIGSFLPLYYANYTMEETDVAATKRKSISFEHK